jgi:RHS repeat-associated protein
MFHLAVRDGLHGASVRSCVLFFLLLTFGACAPADAAVGRTPGTFAVSPAGAATYAIPIWAPPGPKGLQPNIALTYNSRQGNGYVGVGWGVAGLSSIYRCNLTFAQDAAPAPVMLTTSDGLCLDGQRLRLTSGTYGTAGSTYQTEIANFSNVTAYSTAGNGPAYFIVQDRNGRTYTYGNGGNSQILAAGTSTALSWQLNQVSDPAGNTMTIAYNSTTGSPPCTTTANLPTSSSVPCTISWTPSSHGSSTYNYTMQFIYGVNVAQSSVYGYTAGTSVVNTNLLGSITIAYSGTTVKKYVLSYQPSPTTGRDELISVQECADSGATNCLAPTVITYQNGSEGVSTTSSTVTTNAGSVPLLGVYDFNGDGRDDLLYADPNNNLYVAFGTSSGFGTPVATGINVGPPQMHITPAYPFTVAGDVHGAGRASILVVVNGTWWEYVWNSTSGSFAGSNTNLAVDRSTEGVAALVDVNGDGLLDLVTASFTSNALTVYTRLNTTLPGGSLAFSSTRTTAYSAAGCGGQQYCSVVIATRQTNGSRPLDFNGDGRGDVALSTSTMSCLSACRPGPSSNAILLAANGGLFTLAPVTLTSASAYTYLGDINNDGCTDIVLYNIAYLSGCNGSSPQQINLGTYVVGTIDWDGDGRTDILVQNGTTLGVYLSTGNGLSNLITTSIPYTTAQLYYSFDATGDGLDELGYWSTNGTIGYYLHNGAGQRPDLLSSVTDGYGNSVSPTYVSIAQSDYTNATDATYGYKNYIGPLYVVNRVTFSDPTNPPNGTYYQTYSYTGAWTNLQGRGFSGFEKVQRYDSRNALWEVFFNDVKFPFVGILDADLVTQDQAGTQNVKFSFINRVPRTLDGTAYNQRYFVDINNSTIQTYEVGGSKNAQLITTSSTHYVNDNYGNATSIATTVTDNDPSSPPPIHGQSWTITTTNTPVVNPPPGCLSLFTQTQVVYTDSISTNDSVTRTNTFTPDTINCRYTQIVTEPSSSQFKVTEDLTYDSFGNIATDKITGAGMGTASPATRTTTINWTTSSVTTGQFPMSVTDPTGAQTQLNYNFSYGLVSSVTDPNGLSTSWLYDDGFGRKTQENRPDGGHTNWAYNSCANWGGCLLGNNTLALSHFVLNNDWTYITVGTTYYDQLQRPLIANKSMLASGTYDRNEVRYDSLGRIVQQAAPCTWVAVTTPCSYWTTRSYDVLNRATQDQRPISSTNSTLQTTTYQYAGRTTIVTDPQSNAKTTVTDVNGWLRQTKDPYGYSITIAYDAAGSKIGVTDSAGNPLWSGTYNYGLAAFPATATDMDLGRWSYTFDALGEMTAWQDAKKQSFSATYDALSRPLTRTEPDLFTQWTWGSSASSYNIGKLQSVCTGTGSNPTSCVSTPGYAEAEMYDSKSRLSQRAITTLALGTLTYTWQYNANSGFLDTLTYPVSTNSYALQLKYGYQNGILQSVTDVSDTPNVTVWQANTMNPTGQITQETLGNGIVTNRTYDAVTHWLGAAQSGVGGGAAVKNLGFLYDEMGNVTQRQDNNLGLTENIYYDNDYRFSYSKLNGTQNLSVTYDNMGNITSRSDIASGTTWTYDPVHKHQVTQLGNFPYPYPYSYDANGNAIKRPYYSTITWSSYNYPTSVATAYGPGWQTSETESFAYGPDRQRWLQTWTRNGTTENTYYIGGLLEFVSSGSVIDYRQYIYAGAEPVAVYSRKNSGVNTFSYLLSDHQGSVASITNSSGAQVIGESFTPFGDRRNATTWSGIPSTSDLTTIAGITREGYTFQTALGLWAEINHMNGRVQDAFIGRFLSADPYIPDPTSTQSYNRYSYVNNNPLSFVDPSGFVCIPVNYAPSEGYIITGPDGMQEVGIPSGPPNGELCYPDTPPTPGTGPGGAGGTGGRSAPVVPHHGPPAHPRPRTQPQPPPGNPRQSGQCPRGFGVDLGNALVNFGEHQIQNGEAIATAGLVTAGVGIVTSPVGGEPLVAVGGGIMLGGAAWAGVGLAAKTFGGLILAVNGNSQPLQATYFQAAASAIDAATHMPPGVPSAWQQAIDNVAQNMEVGTNPCPE